MEASYKTLVEQGLLGALLVLALITIVVLYRQIQQLHKDARDSDQKNLERMFEAVQTLREFQQHVGRVQR